MARKTNPPKRPTEQLAVIIAFAQLHTDKEAAEKFGLSTRTIQRHRKAIAEGKAPDLARLVTNTNAEALRRIKDLLAETFDLSLKRLQELLPTADMAETRGAMKDLGELMVAKDVLGNERTGDGSEVPKATGSEAEEPVPSSRESTGDTASNLN